MKTRTLLLSITLAFGTAFLGCQSPGDRAGGSSDRVRQESGVKKDPSAHAPAKVKPGSYEDWCDEHKVPESLCTQCNPSLVAAFKATGDWCDEHGLPESQCRICNPDLKIERPPKPVEGS